ncbi:MAG: hypothetical protein LH649_18450 [Pseudanabaena sp. CAN_BIN31]|nr:hypothetical protein [Pseudanabaena sp. CAN_BIN31]
MMESRSKALPPQYLQILRSHDLAMLCPNLTTQRQVDKLSLRIKAIALRSKLRAKHSRCKFIYKLINCGGNALPLQV